MSTRNRPNSKKNNHNGDFNWEPQQGDASEDSTVSENEQVNNKRKTSTDLTKSIEALKKSRSNEHPTPPKPTTPPTSTTGASSPFVTPEKPQRGHQWTQAETGCLLLLANGHEAIGMNYSG